MAVGSSHISTDAMHVILAALGIVVVVAGGMFALFMSISGGQASAEEQFRALSDRLSGDEDAIKEVKTLVREEVQSVRLLIREELRVTDMKIDSLDARIRHVEQMVAANAAAQQ